MKALGVEIVLNILGRGSVSRLPVQGNSSAMSGAVCQRPLFSSSSIRVRTAFSMAKERVANVLSSTLLSSHSRTLAGRVTEMVSRVRLGFFLSPMLCDMVHDTLKYLQRYAMHSNTEQHRYCTAEVKKMNLRTETITERRAQFQERLELDMDGATKAILDNANRLSWIDNTVSVDALDRWIDTTASALGKLRAIRISRCQTVRA